MNNVAPPEKPYVAYAAMLIGTGMILGAIWIGIAYVYRWLRYGGSEPYPAGALLADIGLRYPSVSWVGVQYMIDWVSARPAGAALFFTGLALFWMRSLYSDNYDKRLRDHAHGQRTRV